LALWEWPGVGAPLVFVHGNGFHGRCWDQIITQLAPHHCYAVDLRGHGRSSKPAPPYDWRTFGADVVALGRALDLHGAIGIGHSLGGHAVALAAARAPELFASALLLEPVLLPRAWYSGPPAPEHFAGRRRNEWASPDEMFARFKDRPPFKGWDHAVLRDYCDYGLLPAPSGDGFVLACPPAIEGAIYAAGQAADIYDEIANVTIPVQVVRAGQQDATQSWDMLASATAPDLAEHFARGRDLHLPKYSHFLPMEAPALIVGLVRELAG
jgi:pimeloyl-ACP methyl ester carboxylesterase